jgi:hypothetical protein
MMKSAKVVILLAMMVVGFGVVSASAAPTVADCDTVRAAIIGGDTTTQWEITGIVTSTGYSAGRNNMTVQDGTGAVYIDDSGANGATTAVEGDEVTITGVGTVFNGLHELVPDGVSAEINSSGNPLPLPQIVADLSSPELPNTLQAELIGVKNVFFTTGPNGAAWTTSTNYTIDDGSNSTTFRIGSGTTGWSGNGPADLAPVDIIGTINWFNNPQLHARSGHQGDGTIAYNNTADTGPDITLAGTLPVELSAFGTE